MSEQIRREFTLAFPIEKIKTAIEDSARTSGGAYSIKDRNQAFNSYNMLLVKNLYWLPATITLRAISDSETHFELSAVPGPKLSKMSTFTTSLIEDFLKKIGDFSAGKLIVQEPTPKAELASPQKSTPAQMLALILIVAALIAGLIWFLSVK